MPPPRAQSGGPTASWTNTPAVPAAAPAAAATRRLARMTLNPEHIQLKDGVAGRDNDYGAFAFGQQSGRTSGAARGFGYVEPRFTGSGDVPISTLQVCPRPSSHSVTHTRGHSVLGAVCL